MGSAGPAEACGAICTSADPRPVTVPVRPAGCRRALAAGAATSDRPRRLALGASTRAAVPRRLASTLSAPTRRTLANRRLRDHARVRHARDERPAKSAPMTDSRARAVDPAREARRSVAGTCECRHRQLRSPAPSTSVCGRGAARRVSGGGDARGGASAPDPRHDLAAPRRAQRRQTPGSRRRWQGAGRASVPASGGTRLVGRWKFSAPAPARREERRAGASSWGGRLRAGRASRRRPRPRRRARRSARGGRRPRGRDGVCGARWP